MTKEERKRSKSRKTKPLKTIKEETEASTEGKLEMNTEYVEEKPQINLCWRCALKNVYGVKGYKILNCAHTY